MYQTVMPHAGILLALNTDRIAQEKAPRVDDSLLTEVQPRESGLKTGSGDMRSA